jgi:hypothetical protein
MQTSGEIAPRDREVMSIVAWAEPHHCEEQSDDPSPFAHPEIDKA